MKIIAKSKRPASQIALELEIPPETSKQAYEQVVRDLSRKVKIPGFRPGKVPRQILVQRLGSKNIKAEALEKIVQESVQSAIDQESIAVLGNYQIEPTFEELVGNYKPGDALTFLASMDVPPEVKLGDYQALEVKAEEVKYEPSQLDEFLDQQRSRLATLVPIEDRPAKMGDTVVVDYAGRLSANEEGEEEAISGAEAKDFQLELESGKFIEDLIAGIGGMEIGETKEIPVKFPEDYAREDLAGQEAIFNVTLHEIKEKELPELDDELAEEISDFETLAELREHLESQYQEKAENETKGNIETALTKALVAIAEVDLPETLVSQESETLVKQSLMEMERYGLDVNQFFTSDRLPQLKEAARPEAMENLKSSLSLAEVAKLEKLEVDKEELEKRVAELVEQLSDRQLDMDRVREFVTDDLRQEVALDWLREKATVELVPEGTLKAEEEEAEAPEPDSETEVEPAIEVEAETVPDESE
ncbi:trigger factor [Spirulina sp. 06S082]|uniref:trigger factor n=1 Tax=Spirulina sp. 06S082 TaxID=3110248 RepID=UPI002B1F826A|nr:trigger factor [Spirulina sp. 06S082]MEA5470730.1 trigger factor [Spirulina sp. 06S082]